MTSAAKVSIIIAVVSFSQFVFGQVVFGQGRLGGRGGRDDNRPMSADEIAQRLTRTADFLKRLDTNGNGIIDPDEASDPQAKNMLDRIFARMGKEPHYPMAISEILQGYEAYYRTRGNTGGGGSSSPGGPPQGGSSSAAGWTSPPGMGFGSPALPASSGGSSNSSASKPAIVVLDAGGATSTAPAITGMTLSAQGSAALPAASLPATSLPAASAPAASSTDAKPAPRKPGRFLTARERLPKGLPDWFLEKDVNGDGQVTMAEFTDNWTPDKVAEFARYDLNHDGIITAAECLKVEKAKAK